MESSDYILKSSREYALYVCEHRAIPKVADGLKQVQRMILWTLRNRDEKIKTVALTGLLSYTKLYVHGDAPCNEAISQMAAPFKNNVPLIEGHGAFGNRIYPDSWGQARYTEVRRAKASEALLYKDLDIIPLEDNYDGSNKQPKHFLPLIPLVLLNGISGIAVGWSTNILPRDLKALIEATKLALLNKSLKPIIPSFGRYDISITSIGPNRWEYGGKAKIVDDTTVQITELPPGMDIESFRKRLIEMEDEDKIRSFIDRSSETIDIKVKMKRQSLLGEMVDGKKLKQKPDKPLKEWTESDLIEFFKLRERVTERIVVIDWSGNSIRTYDNAEDLVIDFAQWRLGWYTKRFEQFKQQDQYELKYWESLKVLFEHNFPKRLGTFENRSALHADLIATLGNAKLVLNEHQLDRVSNLPTYRWTKEFKDEVEKHIDNLHNALAEHTVILASPERLRDVYIKELDDLKTFKI